MNPQEYDACSMHPKEFLQMVCMDCDTNSLACPVCIDLVHPNHNIISLKKYLATELPKLYEIQPDHKHIEKHLLQLGSSYQHCFEVMRKLVGQEINELERMYALEVDTLLMENNLVCKTGRTHYTSQNIAVIKDKIRKNQRIPNNNQFVVLTNSLCDKMEQLISENTYEICTLICGLSKFWGNSKDMLLNTKRTAGFAFSQAFKHKSLAVELNTSSGRKIVNQLYDNSYHIGVVQPALNPFCNQIKFKIEASENNCVWLGICNLRTISQRQFVNSYKRGEGAYWIWQAGCQAGAQIFSNILPDSYTIPWNFSVGDIVIIRTTYDEKGNRFVEFEKNKGKRFKAKLQEGIYHACVALGAENESVSIIPT